MADSASVERNPAYPTWEAERAALVLREAELQSQIDQHGPSSAEETYQTLAAEGWDDEHCQRHADEVDAEHAAKLHAMRYEVRAIRARMSIIKPHVHLERSANHKAADRSEYHERLFSYLERIATALETIAGCGERKRTKRRAGAA